MLISGAGMFGVFLFLTYYLQLNLGFSPTKTGVAFLPMIAALMVVAQVRTTMLVPRIGPKAVIPVGFAVAAVGMAWLTGIGVGSGYSSEVLPQLIVIGLGLGLVMPPAMQLATGGVARRGRRGRLRHRQRHAAGGRFDRHGAAEHAGRERRDRLPGRQGRHRQAGPGPGDDRSSPPPSGGRRASSPPAR